MRRTIPVVFLFLAGSVLLWRCGGTAGEECSPECDPGFICYYGTCVPDQDAAADAEVGADADVPADVPAEVEAESGADADGDVVPDVVPDTEAIVDVRPDTEAIVDVRPDTETIVDVRPDTDITDITPDTVRPCGPWPDGGCPSGQVCDIRSCLDGASGVCVPRPTICPPLWEPVCGCDGVTYGNDCTRLAAGAALDHEGECVAPAAPMCVPTADGGAAWLGGDGTFICRAECTTCTAACLHEGTWSEGWYAVCSGSGTDGGCGMVPGLIEWGDCSP